MNEFIESIIKRDPAAKNKLLVIVAYPGVKAIFFHYIANKIWNINFFLIARIISQFSRFLTGIEIHPAAIIGKNLFNDEKIVLIIWIACSFYFATISGSRSLKGLINYE